MEGYKEYKGFIHYYTYIVHLCSFKDRLISSIITYLLTFTFISLRTTAVREHSVVRRGGVVIMLEGNHYSICV